jgi:hypothetical protein
MLINTWQELEYRLLGPYKKLSVFITVVLKVLGHTLYEVKAIPLQPLTGPEGSRRLRLPDFKTVGTRRW